MGKSMKSSGMKDFKQISGGIMQEIRNVMASGYSESGASTKKRSLKGMTGKSTSPNEDINWNGSLLRQRGRLMFMSSPIARSAIETQKTKVVGTGLNLHSTIDMDLLQMSPDAAKAWQRKTEREWKIWANNRDNCDAIGVNTFAGMQQLAVMNWLPNGDVFGIFQRDFKTSVMNPYSLRIHMVEADRICTPYEARLVPYGGRTDGTAKNGNRIYDGVEVDSKGRAVAIYVCNVYPNQMLRETDKIEWERVQLHSPRTGLLNYVQIMDTERPDQYRGVSYLAPVIEPMLNITRYTQSEVIAAMIQSWFTAWIKTETNPAAFPLAEASYGDDDNPELPPDRNISDNSNEYEMGPGNVLHLGTNEDVKFGAPQIPTPGFDTFVKVLCKEIGAALNIPYDVLLKEFNASYSASRAALMEAWESFRMRRAMLVERFCQPVYETWLAEAVALGRISAPGFFTDPVIRAAWCKAEWLGPVQGQLDPTKEVKADILAVQHGFKTHEQVTREYGGGDWLENVERLKEENKLLADAGTDAAADATKFYNEPDLEPDNPGGGKSE